MTSKTKIDIKCLQFGITGLINKNKRRNLCKNLDFIKTNLFKSDSVQQKHENALTSNIHIIFQARHFFKKDIRQNKCMWRIHYSNLKNISAKTKTRTDSI